MHPVNRSTPRLVRACPTGWCALGGLFLAIRLQIAALLTDRGRVGGPIDHRLVVAAPDAGCGVRRVFDVTVWCPGSTCLYETLVLGWRVADPGGHFSSSRRACLRRAVALWRALMGWAHRRFRRAGSVGPVMIGIPYCLTGSSATPTPCPIATSEAVIAPPPPTAAQLPLIATAADIGCHCALQTPSRPGPICACCTLPAGAAVAPRGQRPMAVERSGTRSRSPDLCPRWRASGRGRLQWIRRRARALGYATPSSFARGNEGHRHGVPVGHCRGRRAGALLRLAVVGAECYYPVWPILPY